jgi:nucleoside-diphosphate kinase
MVKEQTLVLVKPDGVARGLVGEIVARFERAELRIIAMKMVTPEAELTRLHYRAHLNKNFYSMLEIMLCEGPVVGMVLEGYGAVAVVRKLVGGTEPATAFPGTIRGDYAHMSYASADDKGIAVRNLVHASGTVEEASYEVGLWFGEGELY